MFYLFELMAVPSPTRGLAPPIEELNVRSATVSGTAAVLLRFAWTKVAWTKIGHLKMDRRDRELLDKQMRSLSPPRNDGVIVVMLAAMFLIGITVGGLLSTHQSEPIQIATMGARG